MRCARLQLISLMWAQVGAGAAVFGTAFYSLYVNKKPASASLTEQAKLPVSADPAVSLIADLDREAQQSSAKYWEGTAEAQQQQKPA